MKKRLISFLCHTFTALFIFLDVDLVLTSTSLMERPDIGIYLSGETSTTNTMKFDADLDPLYVARVLNAFSSKVTVQHMQEQEARPKLRRVK